MVLQAQGRTDLTVSITVAVTVSMKNNLND